MAVAYVGNDDIMIFVFQRQISQKHEQFQPMEARRECPSGVMAMKFVRTWARCYQMKRGLLEIPAS